jgi:MoxR-like ATPase
MIFVATVYDGGMRKSSGVRVRALSNQKLKTGNAVETKYNISTDKEIRGKYEVNSIFAVSDLELDTSKGNFYIAVPKELIPVADEIMICHPGIDGKLKAEYLKYLEKNYPDAYNENMGFSPVDAGAPAPVEEEVKVRKVATMLDVLKKKDAYAVPTIEKDGFYVEEDVWYLLCRNLEKSKNTLLTGPTGGGKTELIALLHRRLGRDLHVHDMSTMLDPQSSLLGVHRMGEHGSEFDYAPFALDIQKPDGIVLEELNRASAAANNILLSPLDGRRALNIGIADSKHARLVEVNPMCCFYATANIGSQYVGTSVLDPALMSRFTTKIEIPYINEEVEAKLITHRKKIDPRTASKIARVAGKARGAYFDDELSEVVSIRETLECAELVRDGFDLIKAMELTFEPLFPGSTTKGERAMVHSFISAL